MLLIGQMWLLGLKQWRNLCLGQELFLAQLNR